MLGGEPFCFGRLAVSPVNLQSNDNACSSFKVLQVFLMCWKMVGWEYLLLPLFGIMTVQFNKNSETENKRRKALVLVVL